jgi:hypothetical protein
VTVHTALPAALTAAVDAVLGPAGIAHVAAGDGAPLRAAEVAAADPSAVAFMAFRSLDVSEAVEATAPAGLALLAPVATWAGITRDDEPGCDGAPGTDDPADHRGTVLRLVARDTVAAARIAGDLRAAGRRALVVAGEHEYGRQLDGQLALAALDRVTDPAGADLVVLCGLAGEPEIARAAATGLPVLAFDGVQGAALGADVALALPFAPGPRDGTEEARRAAELVVAALGGGATSRATVLPALRALGPFDEHGDPIDPPVWLWRAGPDWALTPERPL